MKVLGGSPPGPAPETLMPWEEQTVLYMCLYVCMFRGVCVHMCVVDRGHLTILLLRSCLSVETESLAGLKLAK